jgi:serine/threonine protein phosphatase PrpC
MSHHPDGAESRNGRDLLDLIRELAFRARREIEGSRGMRDDATRTKIKDWVLSQFFGSTSRQSRELVGLYVEDVLLGKDERQGAKSQSATPAESKEDALARHKVECKSVDGNAAEGAGVTRLAGHEQAHLPPSNLPLRPQDAKGAPKPPIQQTGAAFGGSVLNPGSKGVSGVSSQVQQTLHSHGERKPVDAQQKKFGPTISGITQKGAHSCKPGRLNVPYSEPLPAWVGAMRERFVDGLPDGIRISADGAALEGVPTIHGEIKAMIKGRTQDGTPVELALHVPILPDPKALWKSFPSDPAGKFAKPDDDGEYSEDGRLGIRLIAASVRGRSHAQKGTYRDDDYLVRAYPSGWVIVATADGAGSAEFSRQGSHLAVKHASEELEICLQKFQDKIDEAVGDDSRLTSLAGQCMFDAVQVAVAAIERVADDEGLPDSKFSTTLILVAARRYGKRWLVLSFGIGDGGAAIWNDRTQEVIPLTKGDSGEFAGQTRFLRRNEVESLDLVVERTKAVLVECPTAILAMTDGITDPKFETDSLFESAEHWHGFWRNDFAPILTAAGDALPRERLLAWMQFWSPGNHDDRTLAAVLFEPRS